MRYSKSRGPEHFLQYVLDTWTVFCEVNCGLANAISDLLRENRFLRSRLVVIERKYEDMKKAAVPKDGD